MTEQRKRKPRVRLALRRSSPLTVIVVVAAVLLCLVAILTLNALTANTQAQTAQLRQKAAQLENEQSRLELYMEELGTVRGIMLIAQEKLGLVRPDTVVLTPGE